MKSTLRVAIVQESPVYLNLRQSLEKAEILIAEAADQAAQLVVFGETWLSGYPAWLDHCPEVSLWDHEPTKEVFARMMHNSISVPSNETVFLGKLAKRHGIYLVIGINEIVQNGYSNGTIYNSVLTFNDKGEIVNHHRKLMPTFTEKLLYGTGDGHGLSSVQTPFGNIGSLICWEHWMPLTRQAMHNAGEVIHIALWPSVHEMHQVASRQYAFEGRCFVVAVGQIMRVQDIPPELEIPSALKGYPQDFLLNGGSAIIAPDGFYDMKPRYDTEGIFVHEIDDLDQAYRERMTLDVSGHYQRKDVFELRVNRERLR